MILFAFLSSFSAVTTSICGATEYDLSKAASSAPVLDNIDFSSSLYRLAKMSVIGRTALT